MPLSHLFFLINLLFMLISISTYHNLASCIFRLVERDIFLSIFDRPQFSVIFVNCLRVYLQYHTHTSMKHTYR
ncbi:hypothetical protein ABFX02_13G177000 [Erythranthe guttata]